MHPTEFITDNQKIWALLFVASVIVHFGFTKQWSKAQVISFRVAALSNLGALMTAIALTFVIRAAEMTGMVAVSVITMIP